MSRIEEALKKAALHRSRQQGEQDEQGNELIVASQQIRATASIKQKVSALLDVVPLKIDHLMLATARDEKTAVVEEYNKLRSTLIALTSGETRLNTIMVTSTVSEEGKSMTALNLAISLAKEHDHTVLLVDADLRRPSIHRYLDIQPEVGLVHCLRDNLPIENALIKTGVGKLVILPAGEAIKEPIDLLSSGRMKAIVKELKQRYPDRYVIFDTPPALPFADAVVLAGVVDTTLFVVREGKAKLDDIVETLEEFKRHHLLGVVFNDAHSFVNRQSYYYGNY